MASDGEVGNAKIFTLNGEPLMGPEIVRLFLSVDIIYTMRNE